MYKTRNSPCYISGVLWGSDVTPIELSCEKSNGVNLQRPCLDRTTETVSGYIGPLIIVINLIVTTKNHCQIFVILMYF